MFDLGRHERIIIIILVSMLLLGLGVTLYKKARPPARIEVRHLSVQVPSIININSATAEELETLKGVGGPLARRIVEYRDKNGLFLSKEDVKKVKGIGEALYGKIKDRITVE